MHPPARPKARAHHPNPNHPRAQGGLIQVVSRHGCTSHAPLLLLLNLRLMGLVHGDTARARGARALRLARANRSLHPRIKPREKAAVPPQAYQPTAPCKRPLSLPPSLPPSSHFLRCTEVPSAGGAAQGADGPLGWPISIQLDRLSPRCGRGALHFRRRSLCHQAPRDQAPRDRQVLPT